MDRPSTHAGLAIALIAITLVTGCAGSSPPPSVSPVVSVAPSASVGPQSVGTVVITATDCTFTPGADQVRPGAAELSLTNSTDALAGVHLWRIIDGHTYDELAAHVAEEVALAAAGKPGLGHPDYVADLVEVVAEAGQTTSATGILQAAAYGIVCFWLSDTADQQGPFKTIGPILVQ